MPTTLQQSTIAAQLSVDLAQQTTERLVELCLLHRAVPDALDTFPAALKAELERRYDMEAIRIDGTMYAVLQHFANQFHSPIPYLHSKLMEMAATINRDIWFTDNETLFQTAVADEEVAAWLVGETELLHKCLNNQFALTWMAQSTVMSTAILTNATATVEWKQADRLWQIWPNQQAGMMVLAKSETLVNDVIATSAALNAIAASSTAMTAILANTNALNTVVASRTAMTAIAASSTAMTAILANTNALNTVVASRTAMTAIAASSTAMTAIAASSTAMTIIVKSNQARASFIAHNNRFQSIRQTLYSMVQTHWRKATYQVQDVVSNANNAMANPTGLVFACLGYYGSGTSSRTILSHHNGAEAASAGSTSNPNRMASLDGVSFNGATFTESGDGYVYCELWTPN